MSENRYGVWMLCSNNNVNKPPVQLSSVIQFNHYRRYHILATRILEGGEKCRSKRWRILNVFSELMVRERKANVSIGSEDSQKKTQR